MPRQTEARLKPEVGNTREAKIAAMLASGLGGAAIQAALESEYTETIPTNDPRRKSIKGCKPFDATARQRQLEAIRSTRRLMRIDDEDVQALVDMSNGGAAIQSIVETPLANMRRRSSGEPAIDRIFGESRYIWLQNHNEKKPDKGLYQKGDYMPHWLPFSIAHRGFLLDSDKEILREARELAKVKEETLRGTHDLCYIEHGLPDSFLSIFAGSPGVGKSRLAIKLTKAMNAQERLRSKLYKLPPRPVLYYNGEAEKSQFRQWCGTDVDDELFLVHHGEMIRTERVAEDCIKYRPWVVIIDSFQMIAEVDKGLSGTMRALSRFKLLKNDPAAGMSHFLFISQLNKKGEMSGSRRIPHLVDFVGHVTKYERGKGCFMLECPDKNRGGETGRGAIFRHTDTGIECLTTDHKVAPIFKLLQQAGTARLGGQPITNAEREAALGVATAQAQPPAPAANPPASAAPGDSAPGDTPPAAPPADEGGTVDAPPQPVIDGLIV
jgi:hypothetical protein